MGNKEDDGGLCKTCRMIFGQMNTTHNIHKRALTALRFVWRGFCLNTSSCSLFKHLSRMLWCHVVFCLMLWQCFGRLVVPGWSTGPRHIASIQSTASNITTMLQVAVSWWGIKINSKSNYKKSQLEKWQSPENRWRRKWGTSWVFPRIPRFFFFFGKCGHR